MNNFDISGPEFREDPYRFYQWMREYDPVHWTELSNGLGFWLLTRYQDVELSLKDPRFGREWERIMPASALPTIDPNYGQLFKMISEWMLLRDPPDHTRLRGLVNRAFTPRMVERLRPRIVALTDKLIDELRERDQFDLIADFAFPLPITVITELLGVEHDDRKLFRQWSAEILGAIDLNSSESKYLRANQAILEMLDYLREMVAMRRAAPQDDLLSALIAAEEAGDRLTESELYSTCILLLFAGHETTVNLIGNGMLALLENPDELEKLRRDATLINSAIEELLRYDSPVQITIRLIFEDLQIGDISLRRGQQVGIALASANRDESYFEHADKLDITRRENRHLSFGMGIHFCVGAPLARLEAAIAITALLQQLPPLVRAEDSLKWRETIALRGLASLPLKLSR